MLWKYTVYSQRIVYTICLLWFCVRTCSRSIVSVCFPYFPSSPMHASLQLENRICRTINRNGNWLSCEFISVAIYLRCWHGKWKPISQSPSHSECFLVPTFGFKFSSIDSVFWGPLISGAPAFLSEGIKKAQAAFHTVWIPVSLPIAAEGCWCGSGRCKALQRTAGKQVWSPKKAFYFIFHFVCPAKLHRKASVWREEGMRAAKEVFYLQWALI